MGFINEEKNFSVDITHFLVSSQAISTLSRFTICELSRLTFKASTKLLLPSCFNKKIYRDRKGMISLVRKLYQISIILDNNPKNFYSQVC